MCDTLRFENKDLRMALGGLNKERGGGGESNAMLDAESDKIEVRLALLTTHHPPPTTHHPPLTPHPSPITPHPSQVQLALLRKRQNQLQVTLAVALARTLTLSLPLP